MRKLIVIVAALLTPFAVWVAGCRQDPRQTAFPGGPEVKNLARSAEPELAAARAPAIPSIIDPEVLATPDQPTFARIRAVMDREAQLAGRYNEPGLFVLPRQDSMEMMAVLPEPAPARMTMPMDSRETALAAAPPVQVPARRFWSVPAAPVAIPEDPGAYQRSDISAMAAPQPPVAHYQPAPQPPAQPMAMPPDLPLEAIPGIYMGTDDPGADLPDLFGPLSSVPARAGSGAGEGVLALPPSLSSAVFESVSIDDLNFAAREAGGFRPPPNFDVKTLMPFSKIPAPETGSLSSGKGSALDLLLGKGDVKSALEPLPDLGALSRMEAAAASAPRTEKGGHSPLPIPEELIAARSPATAPVAMPHPPAAPSKTREKFSREMYMSDFWETHLPKPPPLEAIPELPEPAEPAMASRQPQLPQPPPSEIMRGLPPPAEPLWIPSPPAESSRSPAAFEAAADSSAAVPAPPPSGAPASPELSMPKNILDMELSELKRDLSQPLEAPPIPPIEAPAGRPTPIPLRPILGKADLKNPAITRIDATVEAPPLLF